MKNLANCKPSEFLRQTNLIRKSVAKWLDITKVLKIRQNRPNIREDMTDDEKKAEIEKQVGKNISNMLDAVLDEHPDETLEILALMCFVDPKDVDNHEMSEYLDSFAELIGNKSVINFLSSLMHLDQKNTSDAQKQ